MLQRSLFLLAVTYRGLGFLRVVAKQEKEQQTRIRVLIAIDEVTSTPGMREFVHSFQMFVRQDLPVFLILTGLFQNIDLLQNKKGLTFLYRAPKITLSPLSIRAISRQYQ